MKLFCSYGRMGPLGYLRWSEGSRMNQYIMAVLVTFPALMIGMIMGWVSPSIPLLQAEDGPLDEPVSDRHLAWMASVTFLVAFPTMLFGGLVTDTIGRKYCILIASFSVGLCWLVKIVWLQSETIIFARSLSGIGNAIAYVVAPIYVKEISDDNIRGALCSLLILSQNFGFIIIYVIGDLLSFYTVLWICLVFPVVHFIVFLSAPETPSYLIRKGKVEEAIEVLAWLHSVDIDDKKILEHVEILKDEKKQEDCDTEKSSLRALLSDRIALKAFVICSTILLIQELCGYLILLTYASEVFAEANMGSALTPNKQTIVLGVVQLVGSIVASCLVEKAGRRNLLTIMSFATGIGMLGLGTCFFLNKRGTAAPGWLPISAMCLSIFSTSAGFQPLPFVLLSEMFSFKLRGLVSSIAVSFTALADFLQTETYQIVTASIGTYGTFWLFSIVCFMGTAFTFLFIPETKDKTLEEIYSSMDKRTKEPKDEMTTL